MLVKVFRGLVVALAAVLLTVTVLGLLPLHVYWIDTLSQLRIPYLIAGVALLPLCGLMRTKAGTIFGGLAMFINLALCGSLYWPVAPAVAQPHAGGSVKIIASNIYGFRNSNVDAFVNLVRSEQPDVLAITEMTPVWMAALTKRLPDYSIAFDEHIAGGAAILSRVPITQVTTPRGTRRFGVRGIVNIEGRDVLLITSHPPAPSEQRRWQARNREFVRLAEDVRSATMPVVIAGDLNCTPWSAYFRRLKDSCALVDSEQGIGPQPSWSAHLVAPMVPIDHGLVTKELITSDRRLGPAIGSDHLPLIVTVGLR